MEMQKEIAFLKQMNEEKASEATQQVDRLKRIHYEIARIQTRIDDT